ncbi:MAG: hypothetical protein ABSH20_23005 [Tepidisphaeraceae bacterium]|jgi:hypothetical protein
MFLCTDLDLLAFEPWLFRDASFASQLLSSGTGNLAATSFSRGSGSFADDHVAANCIITLAGEVAGCYPIVAVVSDTALVVSSLHEGLFPESGDPVPSPVGNGSGLAFVIRTFAPQRRIVSEVILSAAGVGKNPKLSADNIILAPAIRHAAALGSLQLVYSALAAASSEPAGLSLRADYYERLYRRALSRLTVQFDTNGDGLADLTRCLNIVNLVRD